MSLSGCSNCPLGSPAPQPCAWAPVMGGTGWMPASSGQVGPGCWGAAGQLWALQMGTPWVVFPGTVPQHPLPTLCLPAAGCQLGPGHHSAPWLTA